MSNILTNQLMRATLSRFEAQRQEALAILELYLNTAVGVGDHPNILDELAAATTRLSEAEEALGALQRNFLDTLNTGNEDLPEE